MTDPTPNAKQDAGNGPGNAGGNGAPVKMPRKVAAKMPGGITGKGFRPGQTGNPQGGRLGPRKEAFLFGNYLRAWLQEKAWTRDAEGNKLKKEYRLKTVIDTLAANKPEILLHYAYGKPVEVHEVAAAEGTELEFVVRVHGKDVP